LVIDEILDKRVGSTVFSAQDPDGRDYLVFEETAASGTSWMCAPISPLALRCVRTGRANLRDPFRHTATGYVLAFRAGLEGDVATSIVLCNGIDDDLLPSCDERPARVA
jgi:hypothetical protein